MQKAHFAFAVVAFACLATTASAENSQRRQFLAHGVMTPWPTLGQQGCFSDVWGGVVNNCGVNHLVVFNLPVESFNDLHNDVSGTQSVAITTAGSYNGGFSCKPQAVREDGDWWWDSAVITINSSNYSWPAAFLYSNAYVPSNAGFRLICSDVHPNEGVGFIYLMRS